MRLRLILSATLTGILMVGGAWAGIGLAPVDTAVTPRTPGDGPVPAALNPEPVAIGALAEGTLLAGASKVNIAPRPEDYNGTWQTEGCATMGDDADQALTHVADFRLPWPEATDCIYMGGYGIGPMNPIKQFDNPGDTGTIDGQPIRGYGLWSRSVALSDGRDTVVLTILDGASYFGAYRSMCDGCGAFDLQQELGAELQIDPAGLVFASTHSHTAPDFIGGWGGVPEWYMKQVADSMRTSVREAVKSMRPAVLHAGDTLARPHNGERRDTYHSAEDQTVSWFRAADASNGETIATVGAFAAHPTTVDEGAGVAHADWPALFEKGVEDRFGGIGLLFMTGLGNMSARGGTFMGANLAKVIPAQGTVVAANPDVRAAQEFWNQPVTNSGLTALGVPGFFDRPLADGPASVAVGKSANKQCRSASPISVRTAVTAIKIGDVAITAAPGEVFSNLTNTLKERAPVALPIGQANDGLGYIIQSFETDHAGRQVTGFVGGPGDDLEPVVPEGAVVEYEDAYSIDACFGDMVLSTTMRLLAGL